MTSCRLTIVSVQRPFKMYGRVFVLFVSIFCFSNVIFAQQSPTQTIPSVLTPTNFRIGEKLSYNVSFGKFPDAAYVETYVVSRGRLSGKDAIEIRSKIKTLDLVRSAFFLIDESRTVFAAPDSGLPLYISTNIHASAIPKETVTNYLSQPSANYDLLTLIYKAREAGGAGTFSFVENAQNYTATFQPTVAEHLKNAVGEFDTTVSTVQSAYLTANGITDLKINFTNDDTRVPVLIRFKTAKGIFRAMIAGITLPDPEPPVVVSTPKPTPVTVASPKPPVKPTPTPDNYVENRPLLPELGFQLGEVLEYRILSAGKPAANLTLNVHERKQVKKEDTLVLTATVTGVEADNTTFRLGDAATVLVDPDTLAPKSMEAKFDSPLIGLSQTLSFDNKTGNISFGAKEPIDSPIGTHTLVSLLYAMRSFNLKPSKDPSNPVNDTRVAVFWETKAYIFTLRPSNPDVITVNGEKVAAQMVTIKTGNKDLDALSLKVWLGTDDRVPVKIAFGTFQAELVSQSSNIAK
ncbi:hypothetical protein BH10ACI2_BH10ACI2_22020 [soil metagenome]